MNQALGMMPIVGGLLAMGLLLLVYGLLRLLNLPRAWRYAQSLSPLLAAGLLALFLATTLGIALEPWMGPLAEPAAYALPIAALDAAPAILSTTLVWLLTFALVKIGLLLVLLILIGLLWLIGRSRSDCGPRLPRAPAYRIEANNAILLRPGWLFLRMLAGLTGTLIVLALAGAILFLDWAAGRWPQLPLDAWFQGYALLALVVLELAWYLGGIAQPGDPAQPVCGANRAEPWREALLQADRKLWPERLLVWTRTLFGPPSTAAGATPETPARLMTGTEPAIQAQSEQGRGYQSHAGAEVIVAAFDAESGASALFADLKRVLARGERVLLLIDDFSLSRFQWQAEIEAWLCRGLAIPEPRLALWSWCIGERAPGPGDSLWITWADPLAESLMSAQNHAWLAGLGLLVFLDTEGNAGGALARRYAIAGALRSACAARLILAPDTRNLDSAYRENLKLGADAVRRPWPRALVDDNFCVIWRTDVSPSFENALVQGAPAGAIGAALALGVLALLEDAMPQLMIIGTEGFAFRDCLANLKTGVAAQAVGQAQRTLTASRLRDIQFRECWSLVPPPGEATLIALDLDANSPALLLRLGAKVARGSFLQILSPPSLLREYFLHHLRFFLAQPIKPLQAVVTDSPDSVAERLLQQLLIGGLSQAELQDQLRDAEVNFHRPEIGLFRLVKDTFGIDLFRDHYLEWEHERVRLNRRILDHPRLAWSRPCRILITDSGEQLGTLPWEHVPQRFLPDQRHSLRGRLYRVEQIHPDSVQLEHTRLTQESLAYRPELCVTLDPFQLERLPHRDATRRNQRGDAGMVLRRSLCRLPATVESRGWYGFHQGRFGAYHPLAQTFARDYRPARALLVELSRPAEQKASHAELTRTWAVLLRELLPTLLPHGWPYCVVAPLCEMPRDANEPVHLVLPELVWDTAPSDRPEPLEEALAVLILEDSHSDLGLVQALYDEVDGILQLLHDYLHWLLAGGSMAATDAAWTFGETPAPAFLAYGKPEIGPELALEALLAVLEQWHCDGNPLTSARLGFGGGG